MRASCQSLIPVITSFGTFWPFFAWTLFNFSNASRAPEKSRSSFKALSFSSWSLRTIFYNLWWFDKIWQDFTKSSLFVLTKNKARVICLILLSFSYLVQCSQLQKRCILFSLDSCLRNAPNSSSGWRLSLSPRDLLNFTQFQLVASSEPQKR